MIQLSENALKAVQKIRVDQNQPEAFLRIGVKGGGCSGMTYEVHLEQKQNDLDRVFEFGPVKVVCDSKSLIYLDGMTIDYSNDLVGGGFRFVNPNATGTCGCGTSFAV